MMFKIVSTHKTMHIRKIPIHYPVAGDDDRRQRTKTQKKETL